MYIPSYYKQEDRDILYGFMREYPFGIMVTAEENIPWATHLPFVVEKEGEDLVIYSHLAAANPQSQQLAGKETLCIFREPHAYISPSLYERNENVPTWNYVAVHAYGVPEIIHGKAKLIELQEQMISFLEPGFLQKWRELPDTYRNGLISGITGFRMKITRLYGKEKLSQNKTQSEQKNIADHLMKSSDTSASGLAKRMRK